MDIKLKFPKKEILSFLGNIAAWTHRCFKQPKNPSILIGLVFLICFFGFLGIKEHIAKADLDGFSIEEILTKLTSVQGNSLLALSNPNQPELKTAKTIKMVVTAYSSTPQETDDTPFITAAGTSVREGIVANNLLPFGTKVRIPEIYGDKIFVVEDRMHSRKGYYHLDIWFSEHGEAKIFGAKRAYIEILES